MMAKLLMRGLIVAGLLAAGSGGALAAGLAEPWGINLQEAYSPVMERIHEFHWLLLVVQLGIIVLVLGILGYVMYRFRASRNPQPSRTSHNTLLEVVWTAVPIVILVIIAIPSMKLLYFSDRVPEPDMTLKVTGHQWYWSYEYPDHGGFAFDSIIIPDESIDPEAGQVRLLADLGVLPAPLPLYDPATGLVTAVVIVQYGLTVIPTAEHQSRSQQTHSSEWCILEQAKSMHHFCGLLPTSDVANPISAKL